MVGRVIIESEAGISKVHRVSDFFREMRTGGTFGIFLKFTVNKF